MLCTCGIVAGPDGRFEWLLEKDCPDPACRRVREHREASNVQRCKVTGNSCGTDTMPAGAVCLCSACRESADPPEMPSPMLPGAC